VNGIDGKAIVVTGGASGLGRSAAMLLAKHGAKVLVADVDKDGGLETVRIITDFGGTACFQQTDVSNEVQVRTMVGRIVSEFGRLDHAFNNAGIGNAKKRLTDITLTEFQVRININLSGMFLCLKYEIAEMMRSAGAHSIVNTSSIAGLSGYPANADYAATKFGVIGLTECAALDYARNSIRINSIAPGPTLTPMIQPLLALPVVHELMLDRTPIGRFADPLEQAQAAMWLLSDASSYVTGACLRVDGGFFLA
jgi:2,5-dichloro-2,5-cyclohexadiene-1,4-diol dehydrogenase 1